MYLTNIRYEIWLEVKNENFNVLSINYKFYLNSLFIYKYDKTIELETNVSKNKLTKNTLVIKKKLEKSKNLHLKEVNI